MMDTEHTPLKLIDQKPLQSFGSDLSNLQLPSVAEVIQRIECIRIELAKKFKNKSTHYRSAAGQVAGELIQFWSDAGIDSNQ